MKSYNIIMLILLFSASLVLAQSELRLDHLGTFKQGSSVTLIQGCADSTYSNISKVLYPNSTIALQGDVAMVASGDFYNYNFTSTQALGEYVVYGHCDEFQIDTQFIYSFDTTPSGSIFSQSNAITFSASLLVMIIISCLLFYLAGESSGVVSKIAFYSFSIIGFIMVILYTVISIQQTLFGFDGITTGIETFWFVVKTGLTIGILAFFIIIVLVMIKKWKIKRGLEDDD